MMRHGTFRLNLRLCEMGLCLDRLAQTESVFANGDVGLRGISMRANPSACLAATPERRYSSVRRSQRP